MSNVSPSDSNGGFPEHYLQVILINMLDMICQVSIDGFFQYVSPSHKCILGYQPDELVGRSIFELLHPEDSNRALVVFRAALINNSPGKAEYRYRHKDGHYIWLESVGKPLFDEIGVVKGAIISTRDITERKQMEETIKENETSLRALLNLMPVGILLIDPITHRIADANIDAAKMIGVSKEGLLGKVCHEYVCPAEKGRCPITDLGNMVDHSEKTLLAYNGAMIPILKSVNTLRLNQREYLLECFLDITNQKKTEKRLTRLTECFLSFGFSPEENISRLVALCGEELGALCVLYSRLNGDMLCVAGQWNAPPGFVTVDKAEGHICYDLIKAGEDDIRVIHDLQNTAYAETDPNVVRYSLKTYVGKTVSQDEEYIGSICAVYRDDFALDDDDKKLLCIIASAIAIEEKRKQAEDALKRSLQEKEVILKEVHHRVKNNLQIIHSLLSIQANKIQDNTAREAIAECRNRVKSIALIHERLYRSENLSQVDFSKYIGGLTRSLFSSFGVDRRQIMLNLNLDPVPEHR